MAVRYVLPLLLLAVPARAELKTDIVFATTGGAPLTLGTGDRAFAVGCRWQCCSVGVRRGLR